jgi:hypothetical protein
VYQVRLSVVGRMPDLLGFMARVTAGPTPTGVETILLRAAQGGEAVECTVLLTSVRLEGGREAGSPAGPPPAFTAGPTTTTTTTSAAELTAAAAAGGEETR